MIYSNNAEEAFKHLALNKYQAGSLLPNKGLGFLYNF